MKLITISREFGSGGRELGKRLSDELGFAYYDREIITTIAKNQELNESFVEDVLETDIWKTIPLTFHQSFSGISPMDMTHSNLLSEEKRVLDSIAALGKDCVIVGRNADVRLQKYRPLRIFVCASMESRVDRCMRFEDTYNTADAANRKAVEKNIKKIDKARAGNTSLLSGITWGDRVNYDLIVNTTGWNIKKLTPVVAEYARRFFENREEN